MYIGCIPRQKIGQSTNSVVGESSRPYWGIIFSGELYYSNRCFYSGGTDVEHSTHNPKIKGLNAAFGSGRNTIENYSTIENLKKRRISKILILSF
jgi:hypothetical protein